MSDERVAVFYAGWHANDRWVTVADNEQDAIRKAAKIDGGDSGRVQGFQYADGRLRTADDLADQISLAIEEMDSKPSPRPIGAVVNPFDGTRVALWSEVPGWVGRTRD